MIVLCAQEDLFIHCMVCAGRTWSGCEDKYAMLFLRWEYTTDRVGELGSFGTVVITSFVFPLTAFLQLDIRSQLYVIRSTRATSSLRFAGPLGLLLHSLHSFLFSLLCPSNGSLRFTIGGLGVFT